MFHFSVPGERGSFMNEPTRERYWTGVMDCGEAMAERLAVEKEVPLR